MVENKGHADPKDLGSKDILDKDKDDLGQKRKDPNLQPTTGSKGGQSSTRDIPVRRDQDPAVPGDVSTGRSRRDDEDLDPDLNRSRQ